ncbi:ORF19 [Ranid herpesvirus 1]|uniref:ORF19 n=1 Tax=Ranid herpesvirus 1 TaxID=85655 RepID=Q14VT9_9VIRU|nr:ORF19 [Ranid herpesvirus 1]ABG25775.1 ORF19 [Ranid herpesvirus 1]
MRVVLFAMIVMWRGACSKTYYVAPGGNFTFPRPFICKYPNATGIMGSSIHNLSERDSGDYWCGGAETGRVFSLLIGAVALYAEPPLILTGRRMVARLIATQRATAVHCMGNPDVPDTRLFADMNVYAPSARYSPATNYTCSVVVGVDTFTVSAPLPGAERFVAHIELSREGHNLKCTCNAPVIRIRWLDPTAALTEGDTLRLYGDASGVYRCRVYGYWGSLESHYLLTPPVSFHGVLDVIVLCEAAAVVVCLVRLCGTSQRMRR